MEEFRLKIYGRVQGVSFRNMVKGKAEKLDLTGWVRNDPQGTVSATVQGRLPDFERFVSWMRESPGISRVDRIEMSQSAPKERYSGFVIRKGQSLFRDQAQSFKNLRKSL